MIDRTQAMIDQTQIPCFPFSEEQQQGRNFGSRLANAVETVFEKGFERVIVIGNDCPKLSAKKIQDADQILQKKDWVLGPDKQGGFYLIGINKAAFHKSIFEGLAWESSLLQQSFSTQQQGTETFWLDTLSDLNNRQQVYSFFLGSFNFLGLGSFILSLFASEKSITNHFILLLKESLLTGKSRLRGPPHSCSVSIWQ